MERFVIGLLFALIFTPASAQQAKQLVFREEIHDFGTVEETKGPVTHEFVFTNNSDRPVKILKVQASCGCTTPGWSHDLVPPGKEGYVQASYNPKGRPGFFTKTLTVTTDLDPNPVVLKIKGQVTNNEPPKPSDYPVGKGHLRMKTSSFNMGRVYRKDEFVVREFPIMNGGPQALNFSGKFVHPAYIKVDVQPNSLAPGEKGIIKISYNGALKNEYGFQSDNIEIETDDTMNPKKSFSVYATLEDFFPEMTSAELAKAPKLTFEFNTLDFGNINANSATVKEVTFTNTGGRELELRAIQPNCSCVTATASKTSLKPGETGKISISFNPAGRSGSQNKAVLFYSNDPRNPVQRLTFTAYVSK